MELEFELILVSKTKYFANYEVHRKGLKVGELSMEEPYTEDKAICKEMIMR